MRRRRRWSPVVVGGHHVFGPAMWFDVFLSRFLVGSGFDEIPIFKTAISIFSTGQVVVWKVVVIVVDEQRVCGLEVLKYPAVASFV